MTMAELTRRETPALPAAPAAAQQDSQPLKPPSTTAPRESQSSRNSARKASGLDSLLARLVSEAPAAAQRRNAPAPRPPQPQPAAAPAAAGRRGVPWRSIGLTLLASVPLAALAFAPQLGGLLAGPNLRPDGTPAPVPDGFTQFLAGVEEKFI